MNDWTVTPLAVSLGAPVDGVRLADASDVELGALQHRVAAYTPVPGGVGPMTINTLLLQTLEAAERAAR